jgi:hypothetical protein
LAFTAFLGFLLAAAQAAPPPGSALERFFVGRTEGSGTVHVIMSGRHAVRDRATGRMQGNTLVLDQVVEEEGKPARRRMWRLTRGAGNAVTGTISDARGPVTGTVAGNTLTLRYRLAEGPSVDQRITLNPGGRTASNRMTFRRFGFNVATVETIVRRVD